jgi:hypothetical protein
MGREFLKDPAICGGEENQIDRFYVPDAGYHTEIVVSIGVPNGIKRQRETDVRRMLGIGEQLVDQLGSQATGFGVHEAQRTFYGLVGFVVGCVHGVADQAGQGLVFEPSGVIDEDSLTFELEIDYRSL